MTLPKFLELTEERQAEVEEQQAEFKKAINTPTRQDNDEQRLTMAIQREEALRATLKVMYRDRVGGEERQEIKEMLAGALKDQGRFQEALKITKNAATREELHQLIKAVERDDGEQCDCPKKGQAYTEPESKTVYTPSTTVEVKRIPSYKHGMKMTPVKVCSLCGKMNVAPPIVEEPDEN